MKVTLALQHIQNVNDLSRKTTQLQKLSGMISSGKKLSSSADDPLAWARSMDVKRGLTDLETFKSNVDYGERWNNASETALNELSELFVQAKETAISAIKPGTPGGDTAYTQKLDQLVQEALSVSNTQYQGRYLFGVNSQEPLFSLSDDGASVEGPSDPSILNDSHKVRTGYGLDQELGLGSEGLFYMDSSSDSTNNLQVLIDLKTAIADGDTDAITEQMEKLESIMGSFERRITLVGNRLQSLDDQRYTLENLSTEASSRLSDLEDTDMVSAISQLQAKTTTYEAALKVTSLLDGMNLVKYL